MECVSWIKVDMLKYLIENNGKCKGWKRSVAGKCYLNKLLKSATWWCKHPIRNDIDINDKCVIA